MFRFETFERAPDQFTLRAMAPPPAAPHGERAMLLWQEHCTECAAPECYASCALYDPTRLGGCRRFEHGIQPVQGSDGAIGEVRFRQWGKLEARGQAVPVTSDRWARWLTRIAPWIDRVGALAARVTRDRRFARGFDRLAERLLARGLAAPLPDRFVAQIYNPGGREIALQLAMVVDQLHLPQALPLEAQPHAFRRKLAIAPGWNSFDIEASAFAQVLGSGLPFLVQLVPDGEAAGVHLAFGMLDFVWDAQSAPAGRAAPKSSASAMTPAKCLVFDLDNTLWHGTLLEGEVTLRPGVAELLRALDRRGILLSIASKNAAQQAMARLAEEGLDQLFLHPQVGWDRKSASLERIAQALDIGLDTLILVDDSGFERAEVEAALPQVEVLDERALAALLDHPRLAGSATSEAQTRRAMYQAASARAQAASAFADYQAFLKDCDIQLTIRADTPADAVRIGELVQRTNQLNFSGTKYSPQETAAILADPARQRFVVEARDRFGNYGIVGFCLAGRRGDTLHIEDLMLSCRVQGKFIEQALIDWLAERCGEPYPARIAVHFTPTDRNTPARMVLETLGFAPHSDGTCARAVTPGALAADFITVSG